MIALYAVRMDEDEGVKIGREIGNRLKWFAKQRGLSNGQLAYKTGLSTGQVSMMLNGGIQNPGIGTIQRYAQALDLTLDQIVGTHEMPEVTVGFEIGEFQRITANLQRLEDVDASLERRIDGLSVDFTKRFEALEQTIREGFSAAAAQSRAAAEVALSQAARTSPPTVSRSKRKS